MIDQLLDDHLFQPGFGNQAQSQAEADQVEGNSSEERTLIGSSTTQFADQPPLQPHEALMATPTGLKHVEITGITRDEVDYAEVLPGRIPN